jgi:hypothetical protein
VATELIELDDGLLVEVQADPQDEPRQIVAGAASRVDGAMEQARALLLKAVEPVASVWDELNRDLTIDQVEIELGLGFEATGKLFIAQGTGTANVNFKLTVRPKQPS